LLFYRLMVFGFEDIGARLLNLHPDKPLAEMDWPVSDDNVVDIGGRAEKIAAGLQAPALELNASETELAFYIYEQSLAKLHKLFPQSSIVVVYIPSNLSSYKWLSKTANAYVLLPDPSTGTKTWQTAFYKTSDIATRSNYLCSRLEKIVAAQKHSFLDTRGRMREETTKHIIHHAWDWLHFDRRGYQALGDEISRFLTAHPQAGAQTQAQSSGCALLE